MKIDNNEMEKKAVKIFHAGDREGALRMQDEFIAEFRKHYTDKDHCSCQKACKFHGNCKECVAIHRAHMDHLPNCFHDMVNERIKAVSELTEHGFAQTLK